MAKRSARGERSQAVRDHLQANDLKQLIAL